MTTVGLIRHGTTEWNLLGRMQGQLDTPLAEVGIKQAEALARRLKDESWDGIITSDLIRARQTADIIASELQIPIWAYEPRMRERSFGQIEGTTEQERIERWGDNWRQRELELGMEPDEQLLSRGLTVLEDAAVSYPGRRVLVVSHGGMIVPLLKKLTGETLSDFLKNTSLSVLQKTQIGWSPLLLNCTKHLDALE
ncbi:histidine phosphatase family protein [Paenibacillus hamazuiensis]|uniref:histidine phosphatase family protein n=1 Tax=Paenibacillus hamazuiensis TaxID=2936508 RepID=UPI0020107FDC|nr:histidine phosphatase family protein [Paenibacillus hamazuiensis]